jgi:hypothetical protein
LGAEGEGAATTLLADEIDAAAVRVGDLLGEVQAQSGTGRLRLPTDEA